MPIERFDHAVLLANDEGRARAFYVDVLGAEVTKTFMRPLKGKDCHRSFLSFGGHGHVIGLFEDPVEVPPVRTEREWPAVVLSVPRDRYERIVETMPGVLEESDISGFVPTYYTHDPEGNAIGFVPCGSEGPRLMRLELDCSSLDEAIGFYGDVFALGTPKSGSTALGMPYAWWPLDEDGGGLLAVEHADAPGANPGQHYAFLFTPEEEHVQFKAKLAARGIEEAPGRPGERDEGEVSTYIRDPWGRKLQWSTPLG